MPEPAARGRPLLDLLDTSPLAQRLLDNARRTVRTHVLNGLVGETIEERVDTILGRVRKR